MALTLALTLIPGALWAQENGVKVGTGRLHPSLDLEARYDSLALFADTGQVGDLILHVRPGISLEASSPTLAVQLEAKGDYSHYASNSNFSYFGGYGGLGLDVNPSGQLGLQIGDNFVYSDRTSAIALGAGILSFHNEAYARLPIRPGGGALILTPGYSFVLESFTRFADAVPTVDPGTLDYVSHQPALAASWLFLPKTSLVVDLRGDIRNTDGSPRALYATAGVSGLLTPKVAIVLKAGYGNTFLGETQAAGQALGDYSSAIGQAEFTYIISETMKFKGGYVRTFQPVPQLGYYGDDRFYLAGTFLVGGDLLGEIKGSVDLLEYATGRFDTVAQVGPDLTYRITDWLKVAAGYAFSTRQSGEAASGPLVIQDYSRHEVFMRATLVY